jgi:hypothetical protein
MQSSRETSPEALKVEHGKSWQTMRLDGAEPAREYLKD